MMRRPVIRTYDDLIKALANERQRRGMTCMDLEARSGLQDGYVSKLENHFTNKRAKSSRFMGPVSFTMWIQGLGIGLQIVDHADKHGRAGKHDVKASPESRVLKAAAGRKRQAGMSAAQRTKLGRKGVKYRLAKLTAEERSEIARRAARARWARQAGT